MKQAPRLWACAAVLLTSWPAFADMPVLTITGAIDGEVASLTLNELRELPQHQLTTSTTVTDGTPEFTGFLMRDLLAAVQAQGDTVVAYAMNDYRMEIPVSDFHDFDVLGALSMDGAPLNPRDKGPVWIVYPRDNHRELQDIRFDTRWVWQLVSLHVE